MTSTVTISATADTLADALAALSGAATGAASTGATTAPAAIDYFPADPTAAPFPSPENSTMIALNGKSGGAPYLRSAQGAICQWVRDATGALIPVLNYYGNGYQVTINDHLDPSSAVAQVIIRQGQFYFDVNGAHSHLEVQDSLGSGWYEGLWPPAWVTTTTGAGTTTTVHLPPMPADPTAASVAPGSSGKIILFGPGETYTTVAAAVAAAGAGDTVKAAPSDVATTFAESVAITQPIVLDFGGIVTGAGTASPSFSGGATLSGSTLADPSGYAHQLGGIVAMTDCIIRGARITGFGVTQETGAGGTSGIRAGAPGFITVEHCEIFGNQNGIAAGGFATVFNLDNVWLHDNGIGDGSTHNVYLSTGTVRVVVGAVTSTVGPMVASTTYASKMTNGGHAFKSRAPGFTVTGPFYVSAPDATPIDLPDGTTLPLAIAATTIVKTASDSNHGLFSYGVESTNNGTAGGTFTGCTFDALCQNPLFETTGGTITLTGCTFAGNVITAPNGGTVVGLPA